MNMMSGKDAPDGPRATAPRGLADMLGITAGIQMVRRRLLIIALVGVTAAVATFAIQMMRAQAFTATALVTITPREEGASATAQATAVNSEIELLRSPALMGELAQTLGLQSGNGESVADGDVARSLAESINIRQRRSTNIVEIRASSSDRRRAQLIANSYADVYIASHLSVRANSAERENSLVARRLADLRNDLQEKESAAEALRAESGPDAGPSVEAQLGDLQAQLAQAQADARASEARARRIQELRDSGASATAINEAMPSDTLRTLLTRQAEVTRRQSDLEARYLPSHPELQAVQAERADVDAQVSREVQRIASAASSDAGRARQRVQSLQQAIGSTSSSVRPSSGGSSERLQQLEREAAASREIYEAYLQQTESITGEGQLGTATARLLSHAQLPAASSNIPGNLLLALLVGLLLGAIAGAIAEVMDHSIKNADDLDSKIGISAIASIPTISKRMMRQMPPAERHPSGYLVGRPMSAFTEALRVLRTVIVYSKLDFSIKVVAITSALPNEGKTTISMCLARVAAMSGQRVCVVDCDLRKQSINDVLDVETDVGILQVLAGEAPWRSAIVQDPNSEAHVLPVASQGFTPRDVFGSDAMARLIGDLRQHYDLVILDCAPILAVAETRILVAQADTTVLVARAGKTLVGAMRAAVMQTQGAGGKVLGVALNCVLPRWQSYSDSLYFDDSKSYYSVS